MAKVYLVGGKSVEVSAETATKLRAWRYGIGGAKMPPDKVIELPGMVREVKDIKGIETNEITFSPLIRDRKREIEEGKENRKILAEQTIPEKIDRMLRTECFLAWVLNGNREPDGTVGRNKEVMFRQSVYDLLAPPIWKYFEENPSEAVAPVSVYINLIPEKRINKQVDGWRTLT